MTSSPTPLRTVLLNKGIMPYRLPLFRALHQRPDLDILVLFSEACHRDRKWTINPQGLSFPYKILPGVCLHPPKRAYAERRAIYINPTLFLELMRFQPDAVVGYEFSVPSMTTWFYSRISRRPLLLWSECTPHSDRNLTWGQRWTRRFLVPRAEVLFGTSPGACHNLKTFGASPSRVLEAPQVHRVRWIIKQADRIRKEHPSSPSLILYVGSLSERKGVGLLLQAFAHSHASHPTARLRLVGEGPLRKSLEQQAAKLGVREQIEFAGFVQPDDIACEYARAGMLVLPSLEDTFAVVVVEGLASGVPVICSSFAGVSAYLTNGEDAFIVDPNDIPLMADRINRLFDQTPLRKRFIERGKEVAKTFEASAVADIFAEGIFRAVGRKGT